MKQIFLLLPALIISISSVAQNEQAQKLVEKEKYNQATEIYKALLKSDAKHAADHYYYLGDIYWRKEKNDSAKYYFMEGIKADETNALNYVGIGKVSMKTNPVEGQKSFDKATSMSSDKDSKILNAIGEYFVLEGDRTQASRAFAYLQKSTTIDPKNATGWMLFGDAYGKQGEGTKQVECYNKAATLTHSGPLLKMKYGKMFTAARNFDLSVKYYTEGLAIDSTYGPIYRELGDLYSKFKKYDLSIQNYKKYLSYIDRNADVEYRYAYFLYLNKNYKDALAVVSQLEAQKYSNAYIYRIKGISNYELGNYDQAKADMEMYFSKMESSKQQAVDFEYYGKTLLKKGQDSLAIQNLQAAVSRDSTRYDLYSEIGAYYFGKENYPEAIKYLSKQVSLNAKDPQSYLNLGKAYYYSSNYQKADSSFAKIIELKPTSHLGYLYRARANAALDPDTKTGAAKPYYEKVIEIVSANEAKYKPELIESYEYIGYYYIVNRDKVKSDAAWNKVLLLDPANKKAQEGLKLK